MAQSHVDGTADACVSAVGHGVRGGVEQDSSWGGASDDLWRKFVQQVSGNVLSDKAVCVRPLRSLVDKVNTEKFCRLPGRVYTYVLACGFCGWVWTYAGMAVVCMCVRARP